MKWNRIKPTFCRGHNAEVLACQQDQDSLDSLVNMDIHLQKGLNALQHLQQWKGGPPSPTPPTWVQWKGEPHFISFLLTITNKQLIILRFSMSPQPPKSSDRIRRLLTGLSITHNIVFIIYLYLLLALSSPSFIFSFLLLLQCRVPNSVIWPISTKHITISWRFSGRPKRMADHLKDLMIVPSIFSQTPTTFIQSHSPYNKLLKTMFKRLSRGMSSSPAPAGLWKITVRTCIGLNQITEIPVFCSINSIYTWTTLPGQKIHQAWHLQRLQACVHPSKGLKLLAPPQATARETFFNRFTHFFIHFCLFVL